MGALDWTYFQNIAKAQLGKNYLYGAKWPLDESDPVLPVDCSGLVCWLFHQAFGLVLPDGSDCQFSVTVPIPENEKAHIGDVGFFRKPGKSCHHVGVVYDQTFVIEARGDPYFKIILRPREKWEAWQDFTGWRRFTAVQKLEAA